MREKKKKRLRIRIKKEEEMKSFGIGLALLVGGWVLYIQSGIIGALGKDISQNLPAPVIPLPPTDILSYVGFGIMLFGFLWYWIIEPISHSTRPRQSK